MSWFHVLPFLEKVFFYIAAPSTVILLLQTLLIFAGGAGDDAGGSGFDGDSADAGLDDIQDGESDHMFKDNTGLRFFTIRGILSFLTVSGWTGICILELGGSNLLAILLSVQLGVAAMIGIAFLMGALMRLQSSGTIEYSMALGLMGETYLPIPAAGKGTGKVSLIVGGSLKEFDAITLEAFSIKTGEPVRVVDIGRDNIMVVQRECPAE